MKTDLTVEQIRIAVEELRKAESGPATRKQLDSLFRTVHNLKAAAAADGLTELSHAAHDLENVLHALRTGQSTLDGNALQQLTETSAALGQSAPIPEKIWSFLKAEEKHAVRQCVKEGANLFLVQTNFNITDFDRQFQDLKEKLSSVGEVISVAPKVESEKINFRIIYASAGEASQIQHEVGGIAGVTVEELLHQTIDSLAAVLQRAVRAGQSAAVATGKEVDFVVRGEDLVLESSLCNALADPLTHLVRNAVDHGIESRVERVRLGKNPRGKIVIDAATVEGQTRITVTDDGRGIDPAVMNRIFQLGFSTATEVTTISGRGVGLDAVETTVKELGGSITVTSKPNKRSSFEITIPNPR